MPYLRLHYCALAGDGLASGIASGALALTLFAALASVAERFFVPALRDIARGLALRDDVAGATLLSFGNGAPDVFAQIAALSREDVARERGAGGGRGDGRGRVHRELRVSVRGVDRDCARRAGGGWFWTSGTSGETWGFTPWRRRWRSDFFWTGAWTAYEAAALFSLYAAYLFVLLSGRRLKRFARAVVALVRYGGDDSDSDSDSSVAWSDDEAAGELVRDADVRAADAGDGR